MGQPNHSQLHHEVEAHKERYGQTVQIRPGCQDAPGLPSVRAEIPVQNIQ